MMEPQRRKAVDDPVRKVNPHFVALGVLGLLLLIALIAIFSGDGTGQDRLGDDQAAANIDIEDPEARCSASANFDMIKREIFRRAAANREDNREAYDQLGKFAVLRAETPILRGYDQRTDSTSCSAYVSIDLPPGVAVEGGRRTLNGEVGYAIQGGQLTVTDAAALIAPLETLTRTAPAVRSPDAGNEVGDPLLPAEPAVDDGNAEAAPPEPATVYPGRPSFDCDDASTRGEVAVCQNPGLAALDVSMAAQYQRAFAAAGPQQRAILAQTRDRFLAYRDNCPTVGCIRDAYNGRIREIRDIIEGRWRAR
ncbi:MAG TPA: hypothetical protein VFK50_06660 [Sphingomicrobium sp.]|nr:hypothetical protein [Sphingomicrobium sp.]